MAGSTRAILLHPRWAHIRRRYLIPVLIAAVIGGVVGFLAADVNKQYRATEVVGVRGSAASSGGNDTTTASIASAAGSPAVIGAAAQTLNLSSAELAARTTVTVETGTTLIDVSVVADTAEAAILAAKTIAAQAITDYQTRAQAISVSVTTRSRELLTSGKLDSSAAESARETTLGTVAGTAQGQEVDGAVAITVVSPAISASRAGLTRSLGAVFGMAAAVLLTLLVMLSGTWRRRWRIRSAADLIDAAPGVERLADQVYTDEEISRLAGSVLESGRACVVLLGDGRTPPGGSRLSRMLIELLREHAVKVARVEIAGTKPGPLTQLGNGEWSVSAESADLVLARVARAGLAARTSSDVVVVEVAAKDQAVELLYGQHDFLPVIEVRTGSHVGDVQDLFVQLADADPLLVLTVS